MSHNPEFKLETIDDYKQHLRRVEDAARAALVDLAGLLASQKADPETGCYKYDGQSAWELSNEINKSRLLFDGFDAMSDKAPGKNLAINAKVRGPYLLRFKGEEADRRVFYEYDARSESYEDYIFTCKLKYAKLFDNTEEAEKVIQRCVGGNDFMVITLRQAEAGWILRPFACC